MIFAHHHVYDPLISKQKVITYQCVKTLFSSEMVRPERSSIPFVCTIYSDYINPAAWF